MNEKPLIVALVGQSGSGKNTVADFLASQGFARLAFGDAVRREVAEHWRVDVRMLTDRHTREWAVPALAAGNCSDPQFMRWVADGGDSLTAPQSAAWVLQHWKAFRQRFAPGYFARILERDIGRRLGCNWRRVVVADLDDAHCADMLRRLGARVLRVHRPDLATGPAESAGHVMLQRHGIDADGDVLNVGSLQALAEAAAEAVEVLE